MVAISRRRVLAAAGVALGTLLAGCSNGEDETTTADTTTSVASTTTAEPATTAESATTTEESTTTGESTSTTEDPTTTAESTSTTDSGTTTAESTMTTEESKTTRTTTASPQAEVTVGPGGSLVFEPESVTVSAGETVAWQWDSSGHNVVVESQPVGGGWTGTDGGSSTTYDQGHTHTFTFDVAGTYEYYCAPHQSVGMRGTVVVE